MKTFLQNVMTLGFVLTLLGLITAPVATAVPPQAASVPYAISTSGAGNSHLPVFSTDGGQIGFVSHANNLVTNDDLGPWLDLFVRDLNASNTVLVSVSTNGFGGANADIALFSLSSNAQVVAFETVASNLAPGDTNFHGDIYARNFVTGTTELVSTSAYGDGAGNRISSNPLISADGRYVIFESLASNLVTNDFNGTNDIFLRDLLTGTTTLVSVDVTGLASAEGPSTMPAISDDGRYVAFVSRATNLVAGVSNVLGEVYRRDVVAGVTEWAGAGFSTNFCLRAGCDPISQPYAPTDPVLTRDGRYVAFKATDRTVVRWDFQSSVVMTNDRGYRIATSFINQAAMEASSLCISDDGHYVGFVANIIRNGTISPTNSYVGRINFEKGVNSDGMTSTNKGFAAELVSTALDSTNALNRFASLPAMSADGSRFVFLCENEGGATNPPPGAIYFRDMASPFSTLLSTNRNGAAGPKLNGVPPALSTDGTLAAWESPDDEISEGDLNRAWDVFAREIGSGTTEFVSARHGARPAATGGRLAGTPLLSANGRRLAFLGHDSLVLSGDTNFTRDLFVRDLAAGTNASIRLAALVTPSINVASASLSGDGRFVSLLWEASNGVTNIYRADSVSGEVRLVSHLLAGGNGSSHAGAAAISFDGQWVAFDSPQDASTLSTEAVSDTYGQSDVFLCDLSLSNAPIRVISVNYANNATGPGSSIHPVISPDRRWISFQSLAVDLTANRMGNSMHQLYARDLKHNTTRLISYLTTAATDAAGTSTELPLPGGGSNAVFTADGRYLLFTSASNSIYRHDLLNEAVVTLTPSGGSTFTNTARLTNVVVCTDCLNPTASADGRFVAYQSPVTGAVRQVYVRDLLTATSQLISATSAGTGGNGPSFTPLLSYDARFVVFSSQASDLTANDTNRATDIFVRDRLAGVTFCLTLNAAGTATGNRVSSSPALSADGRTVAFQSFASDLVSGDYNETRDIFVATLAGPDTDGDGMADDWEVAYFDTKERDGTGDFDGDGASDLTEFLAGTDPTNLGSVLRVLTLTTVLEQPGAMQRTSALLWSATPGRAYRVQFKDDVAADWTEVPGEVIAPGVTAAKTHTAPDLGAARFYRVLMLP